MNYLNKMNNIKIGCLIKQDVQHCFDRSKMSKYSSPGINISAHIPSFTSSMEETGYEIDRETAMSPACQMFHCEAI